MDQGLDKLARTESRKVTLNHTVNLVDSPLSRNEQSQMIDNTQCQPDALPINRARADLSMTNSMYSNEILDNATKPQSIFERSKCNNVGEEMEGY